MLLEWEKEFQDAFDPRYHLLRRIGTGGTAYVYEAADTRHDRHVAIKVLRPDVAEMLATQRFRREVQLVARLTHPHILTLLDSGEVTGLPYYVMPYIAGDTLQQLMARENCLPVADAISLAREVAGALDYAHAAGVVHRDVKPANVLLVSGHAVVTDFGAGRATRLIDDDSMQTLQGMIVGTPEYMSPEQVAPGGEIDGRSDQYSLAVMLHEMLAGSLPFTGKDRRAIMAQRMISDPPPLRPLRADVPQEVERAVLRAMAGDPDERFATMGAFAAALVGMEESRNIIAGNRGARDSGPVVSPSQPRVPSIAVLVFEHLSDDPDDEYLASGLTPQVAR